MDRWDSSQLVESSELPIAVEIEVAARHLGPPWPKRCRWRRPTCAGCCCPCARSTSRPCSIRRPTSDSGEDGGDGDCELTVADCIDLSMVGSWEERRGNLGPDRSPPSRADPGGRRGSEPCWERLPGPLRQPSGDEAALSMRARRGEAGVVLVVVLVFALLLASSVATFLRRATIDTRSRATASRRRAPNRSRAAGSGSPRRCCSRTSCASRAAASAERATCGRRSGWRHPDRRQLEPASRDRGRGRQAQPERGAAVRRQQPASRATRSPTSRRSSAR